MKAVNTRDPVTQVVPAYLVGMLEYAILMGYDWWDVNAALRPGTHGGGTQLGWPQHLVVSSGRKLKNSLWNIMGITGT